MFDTAAVGHDQFQMFRFFQQLFRDRTEMDEKDIRIPDLFIDLIFDRDVLGTVGLQLQLYRGKIALVLGTERTSSDLFDIDAALHDRIAHDIDIHVGIVDDQDDLTFFFQMIQHLRHLLN